MDINDLTILENAAQKLKEANAAADQSQMREDTADNSAPADELSEEAQEALLHETVVKQQEANKVEKQPYITIYDTSSERYVTYRNIELLQEEEPISENEKIEKAEDEGESLAIANAKQPVASSIKKGNTGVMIVMVSIFVIIASLLLVLKRKRKLLN